MNYLLYIKMECVRLSVRAHYSSAPRGPFTMIFASLNREFNVVVQRAFGFVKKQNSSCVRGSNPGRVGERPGCYPLRHGGKSGDAPETPAKTRRDKN